MPWENRFLDMLDVEEIDALRPHLTTVEAGRGDVLEDVGQPVRHVYLPIDCILSVVTVMASGAQVESRTIGRESGYGLLNALGSPLAFERTTAQVGGRAWRAPLADVRSAVSRCPSLAGSIVRHAQASLVQAAQNSACNVLHSAEHRLCRWLLQTQDRLAVNVLPLTQEHLSIMVGVQRTTVTALASQMQDCGMISYVRGKITVLDRAALERCACECYGAIRNGSAALLQASAEARAGTGFA